MARIATLRILRPEAAQGIQRFQYWNIPLYDPADVARPVVRFDTPVGIGAAVLQNDLSEGCEQITTDVTGYAENIFYDPAHRASCLRTRIDGTTYYLLAMIQLPSTPFNCVKLPLSVSGFAGTLSGLNGSYTLWSWFREDWGTDHGWAVWATSAATEYLFRLTWGGGGDSHFEIRFKDPDSDLQLRYYNYGVELEGHPDGTYAVGYVDDDGGVTEADYISSVLTIADHEASWWD